MVLVKTRPGDSSYESNFNYSVFSLFAFSHVKIILFAVSPTPTTKQRKSWVPAGCGPPPEIDTQRWGTENVPCAPLSWNYVLTFGRMVCEWFHRSQLEGYKSNT